MEGNSENSQNLEPSTELTDERVERIRHLVTTWRTPSPAQDIIGFHGTSILGLENLIERGILPGVTEPSSENPDLPRTGDLYFFPKKTVFQNQFPTMSFQKAPLQEASNYANDLSKMHHIAQKLNLDLSNTDEARIAQNLVTSIDLRTYQLKVVPQDEEELHAVLYS